MPSKATSSSITRSRRREDGMELVAEEEEVFSTLCTLSFLDLTLSCFSSILWPLRRLFPHETAFIAVRRAVCMHISGLQRLPPSSLLGTADASADAITPIPRPSSLCVNAESESRPAQEAVAVPHMGAASEYWKEIGDDGVWFLFAASYPRSRCLPDPLRHAVHPVYPYGSREKFRSKHLGSGILSFVSSHRAVRDASAGDACPPCTGYSPLHDTALAMRVVLVFISAVHLSPHEDDNEDGRRPHRHTRTATSPAHDRVTPRSK
ncbi:hypothetical protein MSAN_01951200 [Mycena sanguinolenta]|uniref:Uncharacterized protein n=1 Tax=Mycena sanguinolenta TaxID=230812 RepID=A0A8H6XN94_9AGAR|nr:hypothetical protein MSAN_01951200 [Mycena sanguinolenta]